MTTSRSEEQYAPEPRQRRRSLDEQARALRTPPVGTGEHYARDGIFASDDEVDEVLDFVYQSRRQDAA